MKKQQSRTKRRLSSPRPRRATTIADVLELEPNEYHVDTDTGVRLRLEDTMADQMITFQDLIAKFYRINYEQPPLVCNIINDDCGLVSGSKCYQIVMRGSFYIYIAQGRETAGPHAAQLWFQAFSDKRRYWIASTQLMAFFFNELEMKAVLSIAIDTHEFYITPTNLKKAIQP